MPFSRRDCDPTAMRRITFEASATGTSGRRTRSTGRRKTVPAAGVSANTPPTSVAFRNLRSAFIARGASPAFLGSEASMGAAEGRLPLGAKRAPTARAGARETQLPEQQQDATGSPVSVQIIWPS